MNAAEAIKGEVAERLAKMSLPAPSQPKRALVLIEAAERSRKTLVKVRVRHEGEGFVYQAGELLEYEHPIIKRTAAR